MSRLDTSCLAKKDCNTMLSVKFMLPLENYSFLRLGCFNSYVEHVGEELIRHLNISPTNNYINPFIN